MAGIVTRSLVLASLLAGLILLDPPSYQAVQDHDLELNLMSFNIRYGTAQDEENSWPFRRRLVLDVLRENEPDILGVQEALRFQLDEIQQAFPTFQEVGVARDDGETEGEYSAVLFRRDRLGLIEGGTFWFSDTPTVPGSASWGNQLPRICSWVRLRGLRQDSDVYVFNLHLDHRSQESRIRSARLLATRIGALGPDVPVVVTGDFNAGEGNPVMEYLRGDSQEALPAGFRHLRDTFRVVHPDASNVGTFNGFRGDRSGEKIDFVLVTPDVEVIGAEIIRRSYGGRFPSDHFPISARLRLRNQSEE